MYIPWHQCSHIHTHHMLHISYTCTCSLSLTHTNNNNNNNIFFSKRKRQISSRIQHSEHQTSPSRGASPHLMTDSNRGRALEFLKCTIAFCSLLSLPPPCPLYPAIQGSKSCCTFSVPPEAPQRGELLSVSFAWEAKRQPDGVGGYGEGWTVDKEEVVWH